MNLKVKLSLLSTISIVLLVVIAVNTIVTKHNVSQQMGHVQQLAQLAVKASNFVHESQRERGRTAGFLGSNGTNFKNEIIAQRKQTDIALSQLQDYLESFDKEEYSEKFQDSLNKAVALLDNLEEKRHEISDQTIPMGDAIAYYTAMNSAFLDSVAAITKETELGRVITKIVAYENFMQVKERAGIERAVLSATFANDAFKPELYDKFIKLVGQQDMLFDKFSFLASSQNLDYYKQTVSGESVTEVDRMRQIAISKRTEGSFGVSPEVWFKTITGKIDKLKMVEDYLAKDLLATVDEIKAETWLIFIMLSIGLPIGLVAIYI